MMQRLRSNRGLQGFLLMTPALIILVGLVVIPLVLTLITSFGQRDADGGVIYTFTLDN